uniref:FAD:protein FMN transferase n=1 Tax=Clostridium sp. NkU-1 TaxID=1095009 RepID=UPI0032609550
MDIQNPDLDSDKKAIDTLNLDGYSLVSSGDYERYYIVDGMRYHHIINPDTLMPSAYFRAVSIVCRDSGWADALSTAIFNLPYEKGLALVEGMEDVEAMWVLPDSSIKTSSGYEAYRSNDR